MDIKFGDRRIVGQSRAKQQVERILASERISHAYLISGPAGSGKTPFALAMAEAINGIDNLSDLGDAKFSKKSTWFTHPDIHVFIPITTSAAYSEVIERLELLAKDPYEIIDFSLRPSLNDDKKPKNLRAFYPIDYYRSNILPSTILKPNEGARVVVIMTNVETMRKETANAFLKLLEEPSDRLMFILTTENYESLLPTITSRCQHIPLGALRTEEVEKGLIEIDRINAEEAKYLARVSGGNYAKTRFFDVDKLKQNRDEIVEFLRTSYTLDAISLPKLIQDWQSANNIEGLLSLIDLMEMYIRDLFIYRDTGNESLVTNIDQIDSIKNFVKALKHAKLDQMLDHLQNVRALLRQNVMPRLVFTVLSFRFSYLMRGEDSVIAQSDNWKHIPAFVGNS